MTDSSGTERTPAGRRWLVALPLVIFVGLAVLLGVRLYAGDPSRLPSTLIGRPAPDFILPPLESAGTPGLTRSDLIGDTVTVVNVWASWCVPCRDEHPLLVKLAARGDVAVAGINYKDRTEQAQRFLDLLGNPFSRIGVDANGRAAIDWGVYGVPETFVIDRHGTITYKHIGPLDEASFTNVLLPKIEQAKAH
ncbi:thiol:disulfide interchange protein CycY [Agaricicola taiwanensis]|uniref:Thiol:disulfide interchange protein CycY n=1 Tax=Agaricicola taiwanensis TaxID=591372 RepID=A0A8J2VJU8_9RHOB|nr:DsbE family thiol:disulfide interchange protein [Agaricicola taiwanensis]GGE27365.1 thiol:disulfide interchange protein CycY [Agaricicola taiwanensis]